MKVLIVIALFVSSTAFAQSIDFDAFTSLLTQKKSSLEKISAGMSKKIVTSSKVPTELGFCEISETAVQTVLKIENNKIIVHSKEKYVPGSTPSCAGFETQEVSVIFFEDKPTLAKDIEELEEISSDITSINRAGNIITLELDTVPQGATSPEKVTVKYDISKPSFKSMVSTQGLKQTIKVEEMADVNVNTISLKKVLFCDSVNSSQCAEGDYSDILF
jgi:hypothetical protein